MSAPAAALRPPCGRTGSPSRPRHRCISAGGGGGNCAGQRFSVKMTGKAVGRKTVTAGKPAGGRWAGRPSQRGNGGSSCVWRRGSEKSGVPGDGCRRESGSVPVARYLPEKSALREGEGAWGRGNTLSRQQRPNGGRRPCPLRRRKLRASTAEMRGFPLPQKHASLKLINHMHMAADAAAGSGAAFEGHIEPQG